VIPRPIVDYQEPGGNGPNWRMEETRPTGPSFSGRPDDPECDVPEIYRRAYIAALAAANERDEAARVALAAGLTVAKAREEDAFRRGWEEGYRLGREDWRQR
jgi:flagellar biosynthesis/type III secretory pathway protein FliH